MLMLVKLCWSRENLIRDCWPYLGVAMSKDKKEKKAKASQGQAQFNEAKRLMGEKRYKEAIEYFSHAISLRPENSRFYYQRGNCFREMGAYQRCLFDYSMAIRIEDSASIYYGVLMSQIRELCGISGCHLTAPQVIGVNAFESWGVCRRPSETTTKRFT